MIKAILPLVLASLLIGAGMGAVVSRYFAYPQTIALMRFQQDAPQMARDRADLATLRSTYQVKRGFLRTQGRAYDFRTLDGGKTWYDCTVLPNRAVRVNGLAEKVNPADWALVNEVDRVTVRMSKLGYGKGNAKP